MNCANGSAIFASASAMARRDSGESKPRTRKCVRRNVIANQPSQVRSSAAEGTAARVPPFISRPRSEGGKANHARGQELFALHSGAMADKFGVGRIIDVPHLIRAGSGMGAVNGRRKH